MLGVEGESSRWEMVAGMWEGGDSGQKREAKRRSRWWKREEEGTYRW